MTSTTLRTTFDIRPVAGNIGADVVGVDLRDELAPEVVAELGRALAERKVLFFREQDITHEQQIAFAANYGPVTAAHPVLGSHGTFDEIFRLDASAIREMAGNVGISPLVPPRDGANGWHTDITFVVNPAKLSVLKGVVIPEYGGDTLWTNLVAAYEGLSAPVRALVDGLRAVHKWNTYSDAARAGDTEARPAAIHPVVRVHPETGERAIFVNPLFTSHILGLSGRESNELLGLLYDQIQRPEYTVRFHWALDSIAMWDNRATAHFGPLDAGFVELERIVERVTVAGDVPVGPDGFTSEVLVGSAFA